MQHVALVERWSRWGGTQGPGTLHRIDARAKVVALVSFLVAVATMAPGSRWEVVALAGVLLGAVVISGLPTGKLLIRAAYVLPFAAGAALFSWWAGDTDRAAALLEKSYLSGLAVLLFISTTTFPDWLGALAAFRLPRILLLVMQFLYRYLFVIPAQADRMRLAAECRQGNRKILAPGGFLAAGGSLGVLFARSWERAESTYGAMLSRGFTGRFPVSAARRWTKTDAIFTALVLLSCIAIRSLP